MNLIPKKGVCNMEILLLVVGIILGFLAGISLHRLSYNSELLKEGYLIIYHPELKSGKGRYKIIKISPDKQERNLEN